MANSFGKILLSLVAACVAQGVTLAQEVQQTFEEGIRLIRINKADEGLAKLREVAEADPTAEQAREIWRTVNDAHGVHVWEMLLDEGGEFEQIARVVIDRAAIGRKEMSRDQEAIDALIEKTQSADYATRSKANADLAADHGEFAVPALLRILGDHDAGAACDYAMLTLLHIGRPAVLPLIEALKTSNDQLRHAVATALVQIGDRRAAPALARLTNDPSSAVRGTALLGLEQLGVSRNADPAELLVQEANVYLSNLEMADSRSVIWTWSEQDRNVVPHDVPPGLYSYELAKMRAQDALRVDPANPEAAKLLAEAYIAQVAKIEADPELDPVADSVGRLRMAAMALGRENLRAALKEAIADRHAQTAEAIARELGSIESGDSINGTSLVDALDSDDAQLRYAAALSMAQQAGGETPLPAADRVVSVLGNAVTEEAIRSILVVDGNPVTQAVAKEAGGRRGIAIHQATTGKEGVADFYSFPLFDVVVVSDTLRDPDTRTVANLIKERSPGVKVLLLASSEESASALGDAVDGVIAPEGDLTADVLIEQTTAAMDTLEARRARADKVAIAASDALYKVAKAGVSILPVADKLAAQLDRSDDVAVPAAIALGAGGTLEQADALVRALTREGASEELRTAAADALGDILDGSSSVPPAVLEALMNTAANAEAEIEVRQAAANALGRGTLDAGTRLKLVEVLKAIPEVSGE